MNYLKTKILWQLSNHCKSDCYYCPTTFRGGEILAETKDYLRIANLLIESYNKMNRKIDWVFDGGEPLDMDDIAMLLRVCRTNGESMELNTNGGRLWMDWWAIEPYVDKLILTYHYWQNPSLIQYIIQTFKEKKKIYHVNVPIRPDYFETDMSRAEEIEKACDIKVKRTVLYKHASKDGGLLDYTEEQLMLMSGIKPTPKIETKEIKIEKPKEVVERPKTEPKIEKEKIPAPIEKIPLIKEKRDFENKTFAERKKEVINSSPVYTGKLCNVGIEYLIITYLGWVKGSNCNNQPLGNIWHDGWKPPEGPQICSMQACTDLSDQKITKFT